MFYSISNVSKSFSHGKPIRELIEESALNDEKARVLGHFSVTRFATYSAIVLQKFMHNYEFYYKILNSKQDDDLDKVDNANFVFALGALIDTFDVTGKLSNAIQKPGLPHWVVKNICKGYLEKLNDIASVLRKDDLFQNCNMESLSCPQLSKIVKDVTASGEFQGCVQYLQNSTQLTLHVNKRLGRSSVVRCIQIQ